MKLATTATPLLAAVALAACGSTAPGTRSVTAPPARTTSSTSSIITTSTTTSVASATTGSPTTPTTSSSSTTASSTAVTSASTTDSTATTRTETAPAFVGANPTGGGAVGHDLAAATATLARSGYTPVGTTTYDARDTLRVLIGRRAGAAGERAFFFDQTIYLGTDATEPSAQISLLAENDTEVTLGYAIYRSGASVPSGQRAVRFQLDMGQLSALDPLPSVASRR